MIKIAKNKALNSLEESLVPDPFLIDTRSCFTVPSCSISVPKYPFWYNIKAAIPGKITITSVMRYLTEAENNGQWLQKKIILKNGKKWP